MRGRWPDSGVPGRGRVPRRAGSRSQLRCPTLRPSFRPSPAMFSLFRRNLRNGFVIHLRNDTITLPSDVKRNLKTCLKQVPHASYQLGRDDLECRRPPSSKCCQTHVSLEIHRKMKYRTATILDAKRVQDWTTVFTRLSPRKKQSDGIHRSETDKR